MSGHAGKMLFVDLSSGGVKEEKLEEDMARSCVGGYGLGARVIFERQKAKVDPLGPENTMGMVTGPLTGTAVPTGGRYFVLGKSPLTGTWGDANSGGYFGNELKAAGWDAIFFTGVAPKPVYLYIKDSKVELRDAAHLWGKDSSDTEDVLRADLGEPRLRVACIGPAGEKLSLISGVVNDKGRVAARSGVGALMGSKRLKAVAVRGTGRTEVADKGALDALLREFNTELRESPVPFAKNMKTWGTMQLTGGNIKAGACPVKNWSTTGEQSFPTHAQITDLDVIGPYEVKKYACAHCPIACGGIVTVKEGPYAIAETHKPEYETIAGFGTQLLNDSFPSIIKLNDICNRLGLDTISAGTAVAFAMECYEHGIITKADTDGLDLTWGNTEAIVALTEKMGRREGFGDVLADGVRVAAQRIGKGSERYAMHVHGQEPGFHNALFLPSRGTGYVTDPAPGRHTHAGPAARIEGGGIIAPYPELPTPKSVERYDYYKKGPGHAAGTNYWHAATSSGVCLFPTVFFGTFKLVDFFNAVTGWDWSVAEFMKAGERIQNLRQCFNVREGLRPADFKLPDRMAGNPPQSTGPLAGITIDINGLADGYRKAMDWDPESGRPSDAKLEELGLLDLVKGQV